MNKKTIDDILDEIIKTIDDGKKSCNDIYADGEEVGNMHGQDDVQGAFDDITSYVNDIRQKIEEVGDILK
jgi:hypothetical protein